MSGWLSAWAVLNSLVIMLTLGLAHRRQAERWWLEWVSTEFVCPG